MKLYDYQNEAITKLMKRNRAILLAPCGSGKTIMLIEIVNRIFKKGMKILIVSPKNVILSSISDHVKYFKSDITHSFFSLGSDVTFINRESLHKVTSKKFDVVLIDESSMFKNYGAISYRKMYEICDASKIVYLLTGTIYCNDTISIYSQVNLLDNSIFGPVSKFIKEYRFLDNTLLNGLRIYKDLPDSPKKIREVIKNLIIEVNKNDVFVPTYNITRVSYYGSEKFYEAYKNVNQTDFSINYNNGENLDAGIRMWKKHQIISGGFYDDESVYHHVHNERFKVIHRILRKLRKNVIIFYNYTFEADKLLNGYGDIVEIYDPKVKPTKKILLLNQKSGSHGLNLQEYKNIIFCSLNYSSELFIQGISRIVRNGQESDVNIYVLCCRNTIDVQIYKKIKKLNEISVNEFNSIITL
ncbi:MAG: DEAD/DEAH box helicase family protein [Paraclostridium sp.]